jgi:hypothetical protein
LPQAALFWLKKKPVLQHKLSDSPPLFEESMSIPLAGRSHARLTAFAIAACMLLGLASCSSAGKIDMQMQLGGGVGYDVVKDPTTAGGYRSQSALDAKHEEVREQISLQTLINGIEAAQKDGYDYVSWEGPQSTALVRTTKYYGTTVGGSADRGYLYLVRGWKSAAGNVGPGARPIGEALAETKTRLAQSK